MKRSRAERFFATTAENQVIKKLITQKSKGMKIAKQALRRKIMMKLEVVPLSTSEAEYIATTLAACEAVWLRRLVADFNQKSSGVTKIFCNDRSAITMTKKPAFHSRKMYIDVFYHYIRSLVSTGEIALKSCDTNEQATNIFTKSLPQAKHEFLRGQLGV
ncbi:hypothetical protein T459_29953 [Capsicum annuum]|uniref:Retrovirus-related Pol polyprotein from transposon TNT 1-94 n=1 Tax=Capsicum annuum TaxID=4072 RepID=A0A2G2Y715_CAPAN|nr:hypothetical protein T459_29953 [Capsicum annuum]